MPTFVRRIVTQTDPRFDSLTGRFLVQATKAGQTMFPGAGHAEIVYWDQGSTLFEGKTWQQHLAEGTILIGVGQSQFDEHANAEFGDRKGKQQSATLLIAKYLGIHESPLFKRLVRLVTENDLKPVKDPLNMSIVVKSMYRSGANPSDVETWVFHAIDAMLSNQQQFLDAGQEYRHHKKVWKHLRLGEDRPLSIALIHSNNSQMWAAARYRDKNIAVLVQRRGSGHVQIFGNENVGVVLDDTVLTVRCTEIISRRKMPAEAVAALGKRLCAPGQIPEVPNWCYNTRGQQLLNGSETACSVEPTVLTDEQIIEIVRMQLKIDLNVVKTDSDDDCSEMDAAAA